MRSANGGTDHGASTTEQNRDDDARMGVLVSLGADGSAQAKADEGSDQNVTAVGGLPPGSPIAPSAWISDMGWTRRHGSALAGL